MQLPIDALLPAIRAELRHAPNLIVEAAPGAGKTTRVPPALLEDVDGEIVVLEPRRIAARMAARRVAQELGESVGQTVGYQVRFEQAGGPRTRVRFVTEGVLTRRLVSGDAMERVAAVVLDEFHERHIDTDLALALLRRLQRSERPDLKLVVMSATLDPAPVAAFLGDAPVLRSEGRLFPLETMYTPYSAAPLEEQVASAVERLGGDAGDMLVFLPGAAEIRRTARACEGVARGRDLLMLPLYGDLTPEEQDRAVAPAARRKLILSTNIAESSITIDGVTAVIDSGLARIAEDNPWTGLPVLRVARVSKASCTQRAGRAARTAPGRVIRLYTQDDFARRADHDAPEILRRELSQVCLDLKAIGVDDPREIEWLDAPPDAAVNAAEALLERLSARGERARRMARLPVHPRLARVAVEGADRGVAEDACAVAALLSAGERTGSVDVLQAAEQSGGVTRAITRQLQRLLRAPRGSKDDDALLQAILSGFPDRVARRRRDRQVRLANGMAAEFAGEPPVYEFMCVLDVEDRPEKPLPVVRLASRIEPEWLLDMFPERVTERAGVDWNRAAERVESVSALLYDGLMIEETRSGAPDAEQAARLLAEKALEAGLERFVDREELAALNARMEFAAEHAHIEKPDVATALAELCYGLRSFAELKDAAPGLLPSIAARVGPVLEEVAPLRVRLPNGRAVRVQYESGRPPWIASRLQDFFGMKETPRVARGAVALVVHLLAPNHRPVQTTTDLAGFWERLYPQVRRELSRRYPKHAWPEKP